MDSKSITPTHPVPVAVVNHSLESELMPIYKLDSYVLIVTGKDRYSFIEGLSTNKIEGDCSTVFTNTAAKIIDHVDVVDKGDFLALVGYTPYKEELLQHITKRILGQDVSIGDASSNNSVFLSTDDVKVEDSVRITTSNTDTRNTQKTGFVNTSGTTTINGLTVNQRQSLEQALKPKADN